MSISYRAVREEPGRIFPFFIRAALCSFSPADGTWLGATGSCSRVSLETTGPGATEGYSSGGAAGARTGAGEVVAVVPVMLGIGATEGYSSGNTAGARMGAGTSGGAIVMVRLGVPVKVGIETGSGDGVGPWAEAAEQDWGGKWAWVCSGSWENQTHQKYQM